jgi:hypothetical protein
MAAAVRRTHLGTMRSLASPRLRLPIVRALSRTSIVWGLTVCLVYGPTGCTAGPTALLLLAGLPAVALASALWVLTAARDGARYRIRGAGRGFFGRALGALTGALVPVAALAWMPVAHTGCAAAFRLLLGTTALLAPIWLWLGSEIGHLALTTAPIPLGGRRQSSRRARDLSPSGEFAHTLV